MLQYIKRLTSDTYPAVFPGDEEGDKPDRLAFEAALACLHVLGARSRAGLPNKIAAHVSAFTDTRNSWTTQEAQGFATSIIDGRVTEDGLNEFVVEGILKGWIRPVFSKSTTRVTASGRPAHFPMSDDRSNRGLEPPAWKADGSRLIPAFRWAVGASDVGCDLPTLK